MDEIQADRWRRLRPLLDHAIGLDGDARALYLDRLGGEDKDLEHELAGLLARYDRLKDRTPSIAIGLLSLAFLREAEAESRLDDRELRGRIVRYPTGESSRHHQDGTGSSGRWFVADAGPEESE